MSNSYQTFYATSAKVSEVARYVDKILSGVSRDRIVSVSHSVAIDSGPGKATPCFSVMIVLQQAG